MEDKLKDIVATALLLFLLVMLGSLTVLMMVGMVYSLRWAVSEMSLHLHE